MREDNELIDLNKEDLDDIITDPISLLGGKSSVALDISLSDHGNLSVSSASVPSISLNKFFSLMNSPEQEQFDQFVHEVSIFCLFVYLFANLWLLKSRLCCLGLLISDRSSCQPAGV